MFGSAYCMTEPINVHSLKVSGFENISAAGMQHIGQCLTKLRVFGKQCSKTNTNRSLHVQCRYLMYLGALLGLQWQPFWHRQLMHLGMCSGYDTVQAGGAAAVHKTTNQDI